MNANAHHENNLQYIMDRDKFILDEVKLTDR